MRPDAYLNKDYIISGQYDYKSFGEIFWQSDGRDRQKFIGKEKDSESSLGDFGVRKFSDDIGRFNSIDPKFDLYYNWTPYQYSLNNSMKLKDDGGDVVKAADEDEQNAIVNSVEKKYCSNIGFKDDGTVYL